MELVFCPRCGSRREPGMAYCTGCGANLGEIEAAIRAGMPQLSGSGRAGWPPDVFRRDQDQMAPFVDTAESQPGSPARPAPAEDPSPRPAGDASRPDQASTQVFPRLRRPQAEAREEEAQVSSVWHPQGAQTERVGPVQHGGAQAPWIRPAGPAAPSLQLRPLALLGGVVGVGAAFLPWIRWNFDRTAFHFPVRFLATGEVSQRMVSVGVVLAAVAGLGLLLSPIRRVAPLRRFVGLLVLAVPVLFATLGLQPSDLSQLVHQLGAGAYAAAAGALLLVFG
jgi:hypothetical protein